MQLHTASKVFCCKHCNFTVWGFQSHNYISKILNFRLVCDSSVRLGRNGIQDFKDHPFFEGIDWVNIFECKVPLVMKNVVYKP